MSFAWAVLLLMGATFAVGSACYGVGLLLWMFRPNYLPFRRRLTLPIAAGCFGAIGALLVASAANNMFLIDALYHLLLVREHPDLTFSAIDLVAYTLGGYYATKYAWKLAHHLDDRRNAARNSQTTLVPGYKVLIDAGRHLFRTEEAIEQPPQKGKDN